MDTRKFGSSSPKYSVTHSDSASAALFLETQRDYPVWVHPVADVWEGQSDYWLVFKGAEPVLLWPIYCSNSGPEIPVFSYYFGPVWSDKQKQVHPASRATERGAVYETIISVLLREYGAIAAELHWSELDVRGFLWLATELGINVELQPRFTAVQDLSSVLDLADLTSKLRRDRQKAVRRVAEERNSMTWTHDASRDEITFMYSDLMERKGEDEETAFRAFSRIFSESLASSRTLIGIRSRKTGRLEAAQVCLDSHRTRNAVALVSRRGDGSMPAAAAAVQFAAMTSAYMSAKPCFDFNGANSRTGADEKHSFGATPKLYFRLSVT